MWADLEPIGRDRRTGGYRRFAWTGVDAQLREWFRAQAQARGLDVCVDRAGNQWAWWGDPDDRGQDGGGQDGGGHAAGRGVVLGSHLDSVPDGGAFDGPLGVVSAFAAVDALRAKGITPARPVGVAAFADEEGARFGVACMGSRLLTGAMATSRALALCDADGATLGEAMTHSGLRIADIGRDEEALRRVGTFIELHVEQGCGLVDTGHAVGLASAIWPHGRWRLELRGEANHAGTTRLRDRHDPMIGLAAIVQTARAAAERHDGLATCGKVVVEPNGVNAIPSRVTAWLDARGGDADTVRAMVADWTATAREHAGTVDEESWTDVTEFDPVLTMRLAALLGDAPVLATGAGHDAGILAASGISSAMLFVRNPSGVSHSPSEFAEPADCVAGVAALAEVLAELAG